MITGWEAKAEATPAKPKAKEIYVSLQGDDSDSGTTSEEEEEIEVAQPAIQEKEIQKEEQPPVVEDEIVRIVLPPIKQSKPFLGDMVATINRPMRFTQSLKN
jgi:hypothetical protein